MGATQASYSANVIGLESDPNKVKPDLTIGAWRMFHQDWDKPININFYNDKGKSRFYLGSDLANADQDMVG